MTDNGNRNYVEQFGEAVPSMLNGIYENYDSVVAIFKGINVSTDEPIEYVREKLYNYAQDVAVLSSVFNTAQFTDYDCEAECIAIFEDIVLLGIAFDLRMGRYDSENRDRVKFLAEDTYNMCTSLYKNWDRVYKYLQSIRNKHRRFPIDEFREYLFDIYFDEECHPVDQLLGVFGCTLHEETREDSLYLLRGFIIYPMLSELDS